MGSKMTRVELGVTLGTQSFERGDSCAETGNMRRQGKKWVSPEAEETAVQTPPGKNESGVFQQEKMSS